MGAMEERLPAPSTSTTLPPAPSSWYATAWLCGSSSRARPGSIHTSPVKPRYRSRSQMSAGKTRATTCPSGRVETCPGILGRPYAAMSASERRSSRRFLSTRYGPVIHSSPAVGSSGAIPFACSETATQRSDTRATSRCSSSTSAMRSATGSAAHSACVAAQLLHRQVEGLPRRRRHDPGDLRYRCAPPTNRFNRHAHLRSPPPGPYSTPTQGRTRTGTGFSGRRRTGAALTGPSRRRRFPARHHDP